MDNPILSSGTVYEDLGPTPRLTSSARPIPSFQPSAAHKRLVAELGLRYRPSAQADLEAHAGTLALMLRDLAAIPANLLETAIAEHVRISQFMPKAAELIALARKKFQARDGGVDADSRENLEKLAAKYNAHLAGQGKSIRWSVDEQNNLVLGEAA